MFGGHFFSDLEDNVSFFEQSFNNYKVNSNEISIWEPNNKKLETTTIWTFSERGNWATHNGKYRGNWSPYIPRNVIQRYSKEGDTILDQFVGSGTTLIEAKLLNRKGIGIDINPNAVDLTLRNIQSCIKGRGEIEAYTGDAKSLEKIENGSIDLICTHPPYANIIKYSENIKEDISHSDINEFLEHMDKISKECFRVLKRGKFCAILMGDTRKKGYIVPLGFNVMQIFLKNEFVLKEIIIKEQHNCSSTSYWTKQSMKYNFLLIAHEYLFIFRKL